MTTRKHNRHLAPLARLLIVLLLSFHGMTGPSAAQSERLHRIRIPEGEASVSDVLREIKEQTPYRVAFTEASFDLPWKVSLTRNEYTLTEILNLVLEDTPYTYTLWQSYVIIMPRRSQARNSSPTRSEPIIIDERDLKLFVPREQEDKDTIIRQRIYNGPFYYRIPNQEFYTPGEKVPKGVIPPAFRSAFRWERSKIGLKANLLYGGIALAPNLHAELGLSSRSTIDVGGSYNGWNRKGSTDDNRKLVHLVGIAEYRYWLCERFSGHFVGAHAIGTHYNISGHKIPGLFDKEYRYEGHGFGAGVSYGYMLPLGKRWGLEGNIGLGVMHMNYEKYGCNKCDELIGKHKKTYIGPTRAGISLIFLIQ